MLLPECLFIHNLSQIHLVASFPGDLVKLMSRQSLEASFFLLITSCRHGIAEQTTLNYTECNILAVYYVNTDSETGQIEVL